MHQRARLIWFDVEDVAMLFTISRIVAQFWLSKKPDINRSSRFSNLRIEGLLHTRGLLRFAWRMDETCPRCIIMSKAELPQTHFTSNYAKLLAMLSALMLMLVIVVRDLLSAACWP